MAVALPGELPQNALYAASFAENIARESALQGVIPRDLFVAFVGLVSAKDSVVCAECLKALEDAVFLRASAKNV